MPADDSKPAMTTKPASRRTFLKRAAAIAGVGVVASVGHAITTRPSAVRSGQLERSGTLSGFAYQPHLDAFRRLADLFKQETGSTVVVQPQQAPGATQLLTSMAAGTQPDIACILAQNTSALAVRAAIMPLDQLVYKANHVVVARDFVGDAVDAFSHGGNIFGVPLETDGGLGNVVNVPVDDVMALGIAQDYPPTNGKFYFDSYDQMFELAQQLSVTGADGSITRWGMSGMGWDDTCYLGIMLTMGVPPFDQEHRQFNFTSPAGIEAMRLHAEIPIAQGLETDWPPGSTSTDMALAGNVALAIGSGAAAGGAPDRYKLAGVPRINRRAPVPAGTGNNWGFVGPANARHPNLQTAFLRMACTRAGQYQYDLTYGGVVVVAWKDILLHDTSRFGPPNPANVGLTLMPLFKDLLSNVQYIGDVGDYTQIQKAIATACQAVRQRHMNATQAARLIQTQAVAQYLQYSVDLLNA